VAVRQTRDRADDYSARTGCPSHVGRLRTSSAHMATFGRKVGIESIESVLDRAHRVL